MARLPVRAEGFTTRMAEFLCAADVLVHSTAGLTMLEAELCGTWAISFGWGIGHIRVNNEAYRRFGLAAVATNRAELAAALRTALHRPRPRPDWFAALPAAADETLRGQSLMLAANLKVPGTFIFGAAAGWGLPACAPLYPPLADRLRIRTRLDVPRVALTFDDGPHAEGTVLVLEALARAGVVATFFLVGEQVRKNPGLARELVAQGHGVAVHGDRHRNLLRLTPRQIAEDLSRAHETIGEHTGVDARLHRAPFGIYSWPALREVSRRGWEPVLWSRWGRDWTRRATPEGIAATVSDGVRPRDILLLHDADDYSAPGSHRRTAQALPRVLDALAPYALVGL